MAATKVIKPVGFLENQSGLSTYTSITGRSPVSSSPGTRRAVAKNSGSLGSGPGWSTRASGKREARSSKAPASLEMAC